MEGIDEVNGHEFMLVVSGLPYSSVVKNPPANTEDAGGVGLIPGSVRKILEEEMATHSNILAWKIPYAEEPGGLPSMGSQRVKHN